MHRLYTKLTRIHAVKLLKQHNACVCESVFATLHRKTIRSCISLHFTLLYLESLNFEIEYDMCVSVSVSAVLYAVINVIQCCTV